MRSLLTILTMLTIPRGRGRRRRNIRSVALAPVVGFVSLPVVIPVPPWSAAALTRTGRWRRKVVPAIPLAVRVLLGAVAIPSLPPWGRALLVAVLTAFAAAFSLAAAFALATIEISVVTAMSTRRCEDLRSSNTRDVIPRLGSRAAAKHAALLVVGASWAQGEILVVRLDLHATVSALDHPWLHLHPLLRGSVVRAIPWRLGRSRRWSHWRPAPLTLHHVLLRAILLIWTHGSFHGLHWAESKVEDDSFGHNLNAAHPPRSDGDATDPAISNVEGKPPILI
mmetsp:Transcript_25744/g.41258  ORF Transcript_25744/g.41258 Transcript_25744/m.41258 type:complete len:281 (+) Transcript_25744:623-1465(+)